MGSLETKGKGHSIENGRENGYRYDLDLRALSDPANKN